MYINGKEYRVTHSIIFDFVAPIPEPIKSLAEIICYVVFVGGSCKIKIERLSYFLMSMHISRLLFTLSLEN
jgi:hypothetical protein